MLKFSRLNLLQQFKKKINENSLNNSKISFSTSTSTTSSSSTSSSSSSIKYYLPIALTLTTGAALATYKNEEDNQFLTTSSLGSLASTLTSSLSPSLLSYCEDTLYGITIHKDQALSNWSGTHHCSPGIVFEPKSEQEVLRLLQYLHNNNMKARPIGSGLSPNGLSFTNDNLINLSHLNHIEIDKENLTVTVGAGITISEILKELKKENLTLENFSSIQEQQIGGWTQVSAHGTGAKLSTVEEMIVQLKLATPTCGLLTLDNNTNKELFSFAKVGLGSLGVVTEVTLKVIPSFNLVESTYPSTLEKIEVNHKERLENYRHVRYMWLPYTDDVIVVTSNPQDTTDSNSSTSSIYDPSNEIVQNYLSSKETKEYTEDPMKLMRNLYQKVIQKNNDNKKTDINKLTFTQLRDEILSYGPLDLDLIKEINQAEAYYWKGKAGRRIEDSTEILGFDCGGPQWVFEVCFPIGKLDSMENITEETNKNTTPGSQSNNSSLVNNIKYSNKDLEFVRRLLKIIEENNIPAHCPIEQRWTASSTARMSPAYSEDPNQVFSWVGIIMYLPPPPLPSSDSSEISLHKYHLQELIQRELITESFFKYKQLIRPLLEEYDAHCHWAKIELPRYDEIPSYTHPRHTEENTTFSLSEEFKENLWKKLSKKVLSSSTNPNSSTTLNGSLPMTKDEQITYMRQKIEKKYPISEFNGYRRIFDPKNILVSPVIETLLVESIKK